MNGPEQSQDTKQPSKPSTDQGQDSSNQAPFRPVLGELETRRQAETARERAKLLKRKKHEAKTEFNRWKRGLCDIIQKESTLEFNEAELTWLFVVPARLNRFFYQIMLKEYVRAKKAASEGDAAALVRQEFDAAADAVIEAEERLRRKGEDNVDLAVSKAALDHEPDRAGDPADGSGVDNVRGDHT